MEEYFKGGIMADLFTGIDFGLTNFVGGIYLAFIVAMIIVFVYGVVLWFSFNQDAIIITSKKSRPKIMKVKLGEDKYDKSPVWIFRGDFLSNILGWNTKIQVDEPTEDCVWFAKVGKNEYRQIKIEGEMKELNFKEIISPLAREKFLKNNRLIAVTFKPVGDWFKDTMPVITFAIIALSAVVIYDGIGKASIKISETNSATTTQVANVLKEALNGSTQLEFCREVWGVSRAVNNGTIVYTPLNR